MVSWLDVAVCFSTQTSFHPSSPWPLVLMPPPLPAPSCTAALHVPAELRGGPLGGRQRQWSRHMHSGMTSWAACRVCECTGDLKGATGGPTVGPTLLQEPPAGLVAPCLRRPGFKCGSTQDHSPSFMPLFKPVEPLLCVAACRLGSSPALFKGPAPCLATCVASMLMWAPPLPVP